MPPQAFSAFELSFIFIDNISSFSLAVFRHWLRYATPLPRQIFRRFFDTPIFFAELRLRFDISLFFH
jgi:hypothetical protein